MRRLGLHWWILLGVLAGILLGTASYRHHAPAAELAIVGPDPAPELVREHALELDAELRRRLAASPTWRTFDGIASIFLNLLKLVVIPLVFFSLVAGVAGIGSLSRLGRLGTRTLGWYLTTSLLAVVTGFVLVNLIRPGVGVHLRIPDSGPVREPPESIWQVLLNMVPDNFIAAAARFDLIGVILFALLFAGCLLAVEPARKAPMVAFMDAGMEVMLRMVRFVIALAPVGIAALTARMVAGTGPAILANLGWYVLTVILALGLHFFVTLPLLTWILTRRNPYRYMRTMLPALVTAFSTASSSGTLGLTMERARAAGTSNRVGSFVLPLGATVNMDGTALYEIVSVLFIAQLHAAMTPGFTLTLGQQALIVFIGLMVSVGAAGIPHAGLVMMVIILEAVGLPLGYTALIWTVDRLLDMCRTAVNVWSDASGTLVIAHYESEVDDTAFRTAA